ncbi:MAG TPA: DUF4920 domain-containing protein [Tahibacter sp.]|nr:DUF4920 domain-containing protein [Tahibacter sp.]
MNKWIVAGMVAALAAAAQAHEGGHDGHGKHAPMAGHESTTAGPTPIATGNGGAYYGAPMPKVEALAIADVARTPDAHTAAPQAFKGRITEVCQNQGCWMVLEDGGAYARVFMSGHSFSVPKDARNQAIVYGKLSLKQLDAKQIEHLASEGSKPQQQELQIDATSVWIAGG